MRPSYSTDDCAPAMFPRRFFYRPKPSRGSFVMHWYHGCYFPITDSWKGATGSHGSGQPLPEIFDVKWIDLEPAPVPDTAEAPAAILMSDGGGTGPVARAAQCYNTPPMVTVPVSGPVEAASYYNSNPTIVICPKRPGATASVSIDGPYTPVNLLACGCVVLPDTYDYQGIPDAYDQPPPVVAEPPAPVTPVYSISGSGGGGSGDGQHHFASVPEKCHRVILALQMSHFLCLQVAAYCFIVWSLFQAIGAELTAADLVGVALPWVLVDLGLVVLWYRNKGDKRQTKA